MPGWIIPAGLAAIFLGILIWRLITGRRVMGYLAHNEYWIYCDAEQLPATEMIMTRMISDNPHHQRGRPPIGAREGMLFTDVRTHIGLAKRSKNPLAFRPDIFEASIQPSAEVLKRLAHASAIVKVKYSSEARLRDSRHLQFLPHLADSISDLCGGMAVCDLVMEEIWTAEDFKQTLVEKPICERPDCHIRVLWEMTDEGWRARTRGLRKIGLAEWVTEPQDADQEVLAIGLMMRAAYAVFRAPEEELQKRTFDEHGAEFIVEPQTTYYGSERIVALRRRLEK